MPSPETQKDWEAIKQASSTPTGPRKSFQPRFYKSMEEYTQSNEYWSVTPDEFRAAHPEGVQPTERELQSREVLKQLEQYPTVTEQDIIQQNYLGNWTPASGNPPPGYTELPYGAEGWDAKGNPFYGSGIAGWWNEFYSKMTAPSEGAKPELVWKPETITPPPLAERASMSGVERAEMMRQGGVDVGKTFNSIWKWMQDPESVSIVAYGTRFISGLGSTILDVAQGFAKQTKMLTSAVGEAEEIGKESKLPGKTVDWTDMYEKNKDFVPEAVRPAAEAASRLFDFTRNLNQLVLPQYHMYDIIKFLTSPVEGKEQLSRLETEYQAGRVAYTAMIEPIKKKEFIRRMEAGENPYLLQIELENPVVEMIGEFIFDPLNLIGMGTKSARDAARVDKAMRNYINTADEIDEFLKAGKAAGQTDAAVDIEKLAQIQLDKSSKAAEKLDEFAKSFGVVTRNLDGKLRPTLTSSGRRDVVAEVVHNVLSHITRLANGDPDKALDAVKGLILSNSDNLDEVADGLSYIKPLDAPKPLLSYAGDLTGHVLKKIVGDDYTEVLDSLARVRDKGIKVTEMVEGKKVERTATGVEAMVHWAERRMAGALDEMFPSIIDRIDAKDETLSLGVRAVGLMYKNSQKVVGKINNILANIFMGFNPAYAARNRLTDITTSFIDVGPGALKGYKPWGETSRLADLKAWLGGELPFGARGFGGVVGGMPGVKTTAPFLKAAAKGEEKWAIQVMAYIVEREMKKALKPGRALPEITDLTKAGLSEDGAKAFIKMIVDEKGDVSKALTTFIDQMKTGKVDDFPLFDWMNSDTLDVFERFHLIEPLKDAYKKSNSLEEFITNANRVLDDLIAHGDEITKEISGIPPDAITKDEVFEASLLREAGEITDETVGRITDRNGAIHWALRSMNDALNSIVNGARAQVSKGVGDANLMGDLDNLAVDIQKVRDRVVDIQNASEKIRVDMRVKFYDSALVDIQSGSRKLADVWGDVVQKAQQYGIDATDWDPPKNISEFKNLFFDGIYYPAKEKLWTGYRDELLAVVEAAQQVVGERVPLENIDTTMSMMKRMVGWSKLFDDFEFHRLIDLNIERALRRNDYPGAVAMVAQKYGIASITEKGAKLDKMLLNIINANLPPGFDKYESLRDIKNMDVVKDSFLLHLAKKKGFLEEAPEAAKLAEAKRIKESASATPLYLNLEHAINEQKKWLKDVIEPGEDIEKLALDELKKIGIETEEDIAKFNKQAIDRYVEEPAKELVNRLLNEGKVPYSSNAYGPGEKGVWWYDEKTGEKGFTALEGAAETVEKALTRPVTKTKAITTADFYKMPSSAHPPHITERIVNAAKRMLDDLEGGGMQRTLVEATEGPQKGEKFWRYKSYNPDWYRDFYANNKVNRQTVINSLKKIINGQDEITGKKNQGTLELIKDYILSNISEGYTDELFGELPGDPAVLLYLGRDDEAARAVALHMDSDVAKNMTDQAWIELVGGDAEDLVYLLERNAALEAGTALPARPLGADIEPPRPYNGGIPSSPRIVFESNSAIKNAFKDFIEGATENWGSKTDIVETTDITNALNKYADVARTRILEAQQIAANVATQGRDFIMHSYPRKNWMDLAAAYVLPYHFWYTRTYLNWMKRITQVPHVVAGYARYKDTLGKEHAGAPDWWKYNLNTNDLPGIDTDNPLYFNLEATLNPLNGLLGVDFDDSYRRVNWWTNLLDDANKYGPTLWAPISWGVAYALREQGEHEASARWAGRLFPQSATIKSATHLLNIGPPGGIEPDPFTHFFSGGIDPYERRRVGRALGTLVDRGEVDRATAMENAYNHSGPYWEMAQEEAMNARAPGQILSFFLGVGFKARSMGDLMIDQFDQRNRAIWAQADLLSPDELNKVLNELYQEYPFGETVLLARKQDFWRDRSYAYSVISRIPPGQKDDIAEAVGIQPELLTKFWENHGHVEEWNEAEMQQFMAGIVQIGALLDLPDDATRTEWREASSRYGKMMGRIKARYGEDIENEIDHYYELKYSEDGRERDKAEAYLNMNPNVDAALNMQTALLIRDPILQKYYVSQSRVKKFYEFAVMADVEADYPNGEELQSQYYDILDPKERKAFLKDNPELKGYWDAKDKAKARAAELTVDAIKGLPEGEEISLREGVEPETVGQEKIVGGMGVPENYAYEYTAQDWRKALGEPTWNVLLDYFLNGEELPYTVEGNLDYLSDVLKLYDTDVLLNLIEDTVTPQMAR